MSTRQFPNSIKRGDQTEFDVLLTDYPSDEGWTLHVILLFCDGSSKLSDAATGSGTGFTFSFSSVDTGGLPAGVAEYELYVHKEGVITKKTVEQDSFIVLASLSDEGVLPETENERRLREITERIAEITSSGVQSWSYKNRQTNRIMLDDLYRQQAEYRRLVRQEKRRFAGLPQLTTVRFGFN